MPKRKLSKREDGRYSRQIYLGKDETGKRRYRTVYGSTQAECDEQINELRVLLKKGIDIDLQSNLFEFWIEKYKTMKKNEVSFRYYQGIKAQIKHLEPLSKIEVSKIRPYHLQEILLELATSDKSLSKKSLGDIRNTARAIMNLVVDNRAIEYNPFENIKIPKGKAKQKRKALTDEQIKWVDEADHRAQIAAMIMLYAGLRRGELIALTWNDINLKEKTILINKSVEFRDNKPFIKNMTKTSAGMRLISIPQKLVDFLCKQKVNSIFVLNKDGKMITEGCFRRMWDSYMNFLNATYGNFENDLTAKKKNGKKKSRFAPGGLPKKIETFTPHELRHTYATLLYKSGVDVLTAKELLGHSDVKTTLNIYTHLDSEFKKKTISKLDEYLNKAKEEVG